MFVCIYRVCVWYSSDCASRPGGQLVLEDSWAAAGGRQGVIAVDDMVLLEGRCAPAPPRSQPSGGDCHLTQDMCVWSSTASG